MNLEVSCPMGWLYRSNPGTQHHVNQFTIGGQTIPPVIPFKTPAPEPTSLTLVSIPKDSRSSSLKEEADVMNQYPVELLLLLCCTVVVLTAARGRESTLSILSWHPVPRVAFAYIPRAALGNLEVTTPAREPSLVTLISQTP